MVTRFGWPRGSGYPGNPCRRWATWSRENPERPGARLAPDELGLPRGARDRQPPAHFDEAVVHLLAQTGELPAQIGQVPPHRVQDLVVLLRKPRICDDQLPACRRRWIRRTCWPRRTVAVGRDGQGVGAGLWWRGGRRRRGWPPVGGTDRRPAGRVPGVAARRHVHPEPGGGPSSPTARANRPVGGRGVDPPRPETFATPDSACSASRSSTSHAVVAVSLDTATATTTYYRAGWRSRCSPRPRAAPLRAPRSTRSTRSGRSRPSGRAISPVTRMNAAPSLASVSAAACSRGR